MNYRSLFGQVIGRLEGKGPFANKQHALVGEALGIDGYVDVALCVSMPGMGGMYGRIKTVAAITRLAR